MAKENLIANLDAPLDAKITAAHYLAQTIKRSREPDSTIIGISFNTGEGTIGAELFEVPPENLEEIEKSRMSHHEKMVALAPEYHHISDAVKVDSSDFVCIGNPVRGSMDSKTNYFGEVTFEWRPKSDQ